MRFNESIKEKLLTETSFNTSRSGGPGGQNVNKVNTRVELRFSVTESQVLTPWQKQRVLAKLKNRITSGGELLISAQSERSQWKNRQTASQKFFELLEKALTPAKKRVKTKPTASSRFKRLEKKKQHAQKKQLRKPPNHDT